MNRFRWFSPILLMLMLAAFVLAPLPSATHAQIGGTLGYGSAVFGTISTSAPTITYSFTGQVGDLITVEVMGLTGGLQPMASLTAPDGTSLYAGASDEVGLATGLPDIRFSLFLEQAGSYSLMVSGNNGTAGDFLMRLLGRFAVESTPLVPNTPLNVEIVPDAVESQFFTFDALNCPTTLTVANLSPGQPFTFPFVVGVRDEQGKLIALLRGGEALEDRVTVAANSGRYEVEVYSGDPPLGGTVSLTVTCGADAPECVSGPTAGAVPGGLGVPGSDDTPGDIPGDHPGDSACPDLNFNVEMFDLAARTGSASWSAVPGADMYRILVYIQQPGGEILHGSISFSAAGGWIFDFGYLPAEYTGLRLVLEVWSEGVVICSDEEFVAFRDSSTEPDCENFSVTIIENTGSSITAAWNAYPDAGGYVVTLRDGATSAILASIIVPPSQLQMTFPVDPGTYWVEVSPWDLPDGLSCADQVAVNVEGVPPGQILTCSAYLLAPRDGMANGLQTFFWEAVEGAGSYRLVIYNEGGAQVASAMVAAPATSVTLDVSEAAIGGGLSFTVAIEVYLPDGTFWCVDTVTELRTVVPPPDPFCGDGVCDGSIGENPNTCQSDCP